MLNFVWVPMSQSETLRKCYMFLILCQSAFWRVFTLPEESVEAVNLQTDFCVCVYLYLFPVMPITFAVLHALYCLPHYSSLLSSGIFVRNSLNLAGLEVLFFCWFLVIYEHSASWIFWCSCAFTFTKLRS